MPRNPTHPLLPTVTLIALVLLAPTLATALPQSATRSAAERAEVAPSLFAKLWSLLSAIWANGSILEPDGTGSGPNSGLGSDPATANSGDNGSILEPDGRP